MPSNRSKQTLPLSTARHLQFEAIGTKWSIDIYTSLSETVYTALVSDIAARIEMYDQHYSRFRTDSLVTAIGQRAGSYTLPADAEPLLRLYEQLYHLTNGAVTPLVGQLLTDVGYDANYSLRASDPGHTPDWPAVMHFAAPHLTTTQPVLLDFGAAGKGQLVDIISELIEARGVAAYCVDASGDMRYRRSGQPLRIGLEHPGDPSRVIGIAELPSGYSMCGSAGNRRAWGAYHHIIDPHSRTSPTHLQAVWVITDSTLVADGLTTALFFTSPAQLAQHFSFEYAMVDADSHLIRSTGFPATFFTHLKEEAPREGTR